MMSSFFYLINFGSKVAVEVNIENCEVLHRKKARRPVHVEDFERFLWSFCGDINSFSLDVCAEPSINVEL